MIRRKPVECIDMDDVLLESLLNRLSRQQLQPEDFSTLAETVRSYHYVTRLIEKKSTSIGRLRSMLFGASTESTSHVTGRNRDVSKPGQGTMSSGPQDSNLTDSVGDATNSGATAVRLHEESPKPDIHRSGKKKLPGHGRNGVDSFPTAERIHVEYVGMKSGCACPRCVTGTAYRIGNPKKLIRFRGQAPIQPTIYELESFRCDLCGEMFVAPAPEGVGDEKYDATVVSVLGLLKYGCGMPFNRLMAFEADLGIPLAASTQWQLVSDGAMNLAPVLEELTDRAAQGQIIYNDDTTVKVLELRKQRAESQKSAKATKQNARENRTGMFTTGIVSILDDQHSIALYFSGAEHAGENLAKILAKREEERTPPIQMCDASSRNCPEEFKTILANCMAHARRKFVDVYDHFEQECRHVLEELEKVYANDAQTKERGMSPQERLAFHQAESGPIMDGLLEWIKRQIEMKRVESNSGMGAAIEYMRKHWIKLTQFLRVAGAPLDNNLCERALKKAIVHRKNSLFYKTFNGAKVGDLYMSLIFTCDLNDVNPFDYLTELLRHKDELAAAPERWLPWNYRENLTDPPRAGPFTEPLELTSV